MSALSWRVRLPRGRPVSVHDREPDPGLGGPRRRRQVHRAVRPGRVPSLELAAEALGRQVEELHETLATAGHFLAGQHAAAALFHHYIGRDNTPARRLPGRR